MRWLTLPHLLFIRGRHVKAIDWIVRVWDSRNHLLNYWIIEEATLTTALEQAEKEGTSIREASARVFSNASGSYSSNVNLAVENSTWEEENELQKDEQPNERNMEPSTADER